MYLEMFGFEEKPFHITPNPKFIFLSKNHKEAFAHLLYGIQQRVGFMSLSGEIGTGKTTVLRTLLGQLADTEYRVALIFNPCLTGLELLQTVHREFSIDYDSERSNLVELHESLNQFLLQQRELGKTVVLVVDEAQNLDPVVLEQLRLLSNLETETEKLIQMVLVGQPELDEILQRKDLRQLRQRLAVSYHLQSMDADDTERYVRHRIAIAGCKNRSLFTKQALTQIYKNTIGTPRLINILCDRALLVAYGHDATAVSRQDIQTAQKELRQQDKPRRTGYQKLALMTTTLLILAVGFKLSSIADFSRFQQRPAPVIAAQPKPAAKIKIDHQKNRPDVSSQRVAELVKQISSLTTEESGLQSIMTVAEAWQQPLPAKLPAIATLRQMRGSLDAIGFEIIEAQSSVADFCRHNAPAILVISLPNVVGNRFLAVYQLENERVRTLPEVTDDGWLDLAELEKIWFGKILLPYQNIYQIPLIDRPSMSGQHVTNLQELLNLLPETTLTVSTVYDKQTIGAVTLFQQNMGLAPDGRVGAQTLYWLYRKTGQNMPQLLQTDGS